MFLIHLCFDWDRMELRRELCHAHAPSSRLGCEHSPGSPPQRISAQLRAKAAAVQSVTCWTEGGACVGNHVAVNGGLSSAFQECFQKAFILDTRLT